MRCAIAVLTGSIQFCPRRQENKWDGWNSLAALSTDKLVTWEVSDRKSLEHKSMNIDRKR